MRKALLAGLAALAFASCAAAQRILSMSPFLTEAVYAVGAGEQLVGVSEFSDYPAAARRLPTVSSSAGVSWEKVAALRPDIAITWTDSFREGDAERFARLGVRVVLFAGRRIDDIPKTLREVSRLAGRGADPASAREFEARIERLRQSHAGRPRIPVFLEVQHRPLVTIAGAHFMNDALAICGAENAFAQLPGVAPHVSWEQLLARDPAAIVGAGNPERAAEFRARWKEHAGLAAVRRGALVYVNGDHFYRPTPRLADGIEELCRGLAALR